MRRIIALVLAIGFVGAVGNSSVAYAGDINVSAAASLKESMQDAGAAFAKQGGDTVHFTFGASGQLEAQIVNGAPVDAFISAAQKQVDDLAKKDLIDAGSQRIVAGNNLVLIVPADSSLGIKDFSQLTDRAVTKLAVGEPKSVPAGMYAMQTLKSLKLDEAVHDKLVYGASVRQVLDYVQNGEVSAGIVYGTDAKEAGDKVKVAAIASETAHQPIIYPGVVIKGSANAQSAKAFLDFLGMPAGLSILQAHGFTAPDQPATQP
jgi:molybdate transport system substrate-binding protein